MSPRRRLRTRYERVEEPTARAPEAAPDEAAAPAPEAPPPPGAPLTDVAVSTAAAETEGALPAGPATVPPVPFVPRPPAPPPPVEPSGEAASAPGAAAPPAAPSEDVAAPRTAPEPVEPSAERAPAPEAAAAPAAEAVRETPQEVIEAWAEAFEEPAPVEPAAPRRRRVRTMVTMVALAVVAFATGLVLFNYLVMPRLIHGVGQVTVPDLTNLSFEQAEEALRPLGLQASRAGERFDPSTPRGFVIAQEPLAGSTVRGTKRIAVVVSLGEEFSSVPELSGESVRSARMLIERAGLRPGHIVQAPSEEAGEGLVAGSDPGPETVLQRNTPVHLLVSTGAGPESFVMPDLLGREITGVRRQLEAMGFHFERAGAGTSVGTIIAQQPPAGSRITRATVIHLSATGRVIR